MLLTSRAVINFTACLFGLLVSAQPSVAQPAVSADQIPVWKTITLGTVRSIIDLREALEASDCAAANATNSASTRSQTVACRLGDSANEILGRAGFELSASRRQAELVLLSGKDLGFPPDVQPSLRQIYERAQTLGFALCSPDVGPALRLQYTNQKIGEFLYIAMSPIRDYAGDPTIFSLGNGGAGLLLVGTGGDPDVRMSATAPFVFMRPLLAPLEAAVRQANH
jgi:hypothetical protein